MTIPGDASCSMYSQSYLERTPHGVIRKVVLIDIQYYNEDRRDKEAEQERKIQAYQRGRNDSR